MPQTAEDGKRLQRRSCYYNCPRRGTHPKTSCPGPTFTHSALPRHRERGGGGGGGGVILQSGKSCKACTLQHKLLVLFLSRSNQNRPDDLRRLFTSRRDLSGRPQEEGGVKITTPRENCIKVNQVIFILTTRTMMMSSFRYCFLAP